MINYELRICSTNATTLAIGSSEHIKMNDDTFQLGPNDTLTITLQVPEEAGEILEHRIVRSLFREPSL